MSIVSNAVPNPEEFKNVPETRLRGKDMEMLFALYAAEAELRRACEDENMKKRFRTLPNGWRDLRMVTAFMKKLTDMVQWTVPMEKRIGFRNAAVRCRYVVMQGPLAVKPKPNEEEIITTRDLNVLVSSAWEWRCRMCDDNCDRCELGRVLDSVIAKDRDGGSWANIDPTKGV